jgi:probable HAF family extracellular repeat protein
LVSSQANAINNNGQVVGQAGNTDTHAIIWNSGVPTDLSALSGNAGAALAINNAGEVAGYSYPSGISGLSQATIWNGTTPTVLGTLGGSRSFAEAINNAGEVAGHSYTNGNATDLAFTWNGGALTPLGLLANSADSDAYGINDAGLVVGTSIMNVGERHATLWDGTVPVDLNTLLDSGGNGWLLVDALAINDSGQIVGWGFNSLGQQEAFLLTPNNVTDHWVNTLAGDWATATNWKNGLPTATIDANVDATGTYSVAITSNAIADALLLNDAQATVTDNNGTLSLAGAGGLANPNGALIINAGTFRLNGGGLKAGTIFIGIGGTFLISKGSYTGSNALSETINDNGSLIDNTKAAITGDISGTGSLVIAGKGVLEVGGLVSQNVTFASGSSGTFKLDHSLTVPFTGTIFGLTPKDSVDLADLTYVRGKMNASYNSSAGTLTVTNGSQKVSLHLSGNFTNATWVLSKDATGGTVVVDPPAPSPANSAPGLDHMVALFNQFMAADPPSQNGISATIPLSQIVANEQQFLAQPHHG